MLRTAAAVLGSNLGVALLRFVRNILAARLLGVEDFGVASTFAMTFALLEMVGYLGLDRLMIQTKDGDLPHVQATLQSLSILRGVLIAILLFFTAPLLARFMGVPEVTWGFQMMAVIPILQGLMHLDIARVQRGMNFGPFMKASLATECVTLLAIWPLFLVFGDYRIGLFSLILQEFVLLILTHIVAVRKYRLGLDRDLVIRAVNFGWPLLLNAVLMYGIFQGDRLIVANRMGPTELGLFSLAFVLTLVPVKVLTQTQTSLFLPKLSALQDDSENFVRLGAVAVQAGLVTGIALATGFAVFGPDLVLVLFGAKYAGSLDVLIWLAVMQAVRVAKLGVSTVALARAETRSPMTANLPRVLLLPAAWIAMEQGAGMLVVVWLAILGEVLGLLVAFFLLERWHRVPVWNLAGPLCLWAGVLVLICLAALARPPAPEILANFDWPQAVLLVAAAVAALGMGGLRRWAVHRFSRRQE